MPLNTTTKSYQGFTHTVTGQGHTVTEKYVGGKEACVELMDQYKVGQVSSLGTLMSIKVSQEDGPVWACELEWNVEYDSEGNPSPEGSYGPTESSLTVRMLSLPLENRTNYLTNWNYNLIGLGTDVVPDWWETASDLVISGETDAATYRWIKEASEIPLEKTDGKSWKMLKEKTMPGVETYDFPIYELTEIGKHSTQNQAGWAVAERSGLIATPQNGDFGITDKLSGDWLCEGGSVSYDGKWWIATCTYAHSPDGWDTRLYNELHPNKDK